MIYNKSKHEHTASSLRTKLMSTEAKLNAGEVSALETTVFITAEMLKCSNYTILFVCSLQTDAQ
jgi:hypothetical protein